jgi:uncharacterized membrane protein YeaQ/YmgE (transglycosylase-associated protein family)
MIAIISTLIFGLVVGALAKLFMPGDDPGGIIVTTLLGIAGAFIGKFISAALVGGDAITRWTMSGFFFSILGAVVLLLLYRLIIGRRHRRPVV